MMNEKRNLGRIVHNSDILAIQRLTGACPLTILRRLVGLPVRGNVGLRIDIAISDRFAKSKMP